MNDTSNNATNKKLLVTLFSMRIENLITNIFRCDYEKVNLILKKLETG